MEEAGVGAKCGRWNPTPEQVKVLMDLFSTGLRTPSTDQIQKISSHLSSFGKIESKNVFYWFQNHKARERHHHHQKKRRRQPPAAAPAVHDPRDLFLLADPVSQQKEFPISIWDREGEVKSEREKKTLVLFPLIGSSNYHYDHDDLIGDDQYRASRNSPHFLDDLIEPPLDLTLGFF